MIQRHPWQYSNSLFFRVLLQNIYFWKLDYCHQSWHKSPNNTFKSWVFSHFTSSSWQWPEALCQDNIRVTLGQVTECTRLDLNLIWESVESWVHWSSSNLTELERMWRMEETAQIYVSQKKKTQSCNYCQSCINMLVFLFGINVWKKIILTSLGTVFRLIIQFIKKKIYYFFLDE